MRLMEEVVRQIVKNKIEARENSLRILKDELLRVTKGKPIFLRIK